MAVVHLMPLGTIEPEALQVQISIDGIITYIHTTLDDYTFTGSWY